MINNVNQQRACDVLPLAKEIILRCLQRLARTLGPPGMVDLLEPGKMLRTRLAARLAEEGAARLDPQTLASACAATEIIHTASLCHDDVIDNGRVRRGRPSFWRFTSPSAAVLVGDILLCDALHLLAGAEADPGRHGGLPLQVNGCRYLAALLEKTKEVCAAEAEQELTTRGGRPDDATLLRIARMKTGPLFAFVAMAAGGDDADLASALDEAGYCIGTAYQLADDLLDVCGNERSAGKTLGTDSLRRKFTLPQASPDAAREQVIAHCAAALDCLSLWPRAHRAVTLFLSCDLQPVFDSCDLHLDLCERFTV